MVRSSSNSAVVGFKVGNQGWIEEDLMMRTLRWEIELCKTLGNSERGKEVNENISGQFKFLRELEEISVYE